MKIAITGTIGSGKSEMSNYIRNKYGLYVFDCDKTNADILNANSLILKDSFPNVYDENVLNKKKLAAIVFKDKEKRKLLESIMHPLILEKMLIDSNIYNPFIAEVPLLFESAWDKYFDLKVLVVSDEDVALKRLKERGLTLSESKNRIKNQMSISDKIARSDVIIYNNSSLASFYKKIDDWIENVR